MALALPDPASPAAANPPQTRAHRRWRTGQGHAQAERWAQAALDFEAAFGTFDDAAYGLAAAHALIKAGQPDVARQRACSLRQHRPTLTLAYTLESHALLERGLVAEAIACLQALPAQASRDAPHWVTLGVALALSHRHDEAVGAFLQALALKMDDGPTHFRLGMSFKDLGLKAEAAECVRTALLLGLGTSDLAARAQLVFLEREACRWPQAAQELANLRAAVQAVPDGIAVETGPFPHAVFVADPLEQLKVARHYALHVASRVGVLPRRAAKPHGGRLRVGYLSADFHQHATSQLMVQMLECHDRSRVEVTLLSAGPDDTSALRARIRASTEHFVELRGESHAAMAQRIRALGIDILVDVKGATYGTLMPVTAQRAAPLQVSWLGFPGTTGAPYVDYLIGDAVVTPLADAAHFSEKLAQLPRCYQPNDAQRALPQPSMRSDWGAPEGVPLLCAFHQSYKISDEVFDAWCGVLHAVPDAVLWLLCWNANVQAALEAAARERGIASQRLCFAPVLPQGQHLSRLACADLYLDAWPCNAHTTAGEALWAGVPVVTLSGPTFVQRVAASLLHQVGHHEFACADVGEFVRTAAALATDTLRRRRLSAQLVAQRATGSLFDGRGFARDIESLFDRMWARAVAGLPADHLPAPAAAPI